MREEYEPCPLCRQYSHSIKDDAVAKAFRHFEAMFSHRGDGIPTQHAFDLETRDAAQVLTAAIETLSRENRELREALAGLCRRYAAAEAAVHFAHDDGFEWPTDPFGEAALAFADPTDVPEYAVLTTLGKESAAQPHPGKDR